ncbi:methylated-DNA--[protein]-cysteine S-methyltransferase [Ochrovirga pacifica]|uniref:methylated-DNA--[protein]-cysteine S-methyltransferase n=1 Tax=Ochrovirga pacifica TaxID=1042376 RepID=UPI000255A29F|nr:methylated-DNA--[protein]-cysteine S-methyltransferase [Ochrovirga pacifica]
MQINKQLLDFSIIERIVGCKQNQKKYLVAKDIISSIGLDKSCLNKMFIDWAGVDLDTFLLGINTNCLEKFSNHSELSLFDIINNDETFRNKHFDKPSKYINTIFLDEFKKNNTVIYYQYSVSIFGEVLVAFTEKGVCYLGFHDDKEEAVFLLKLRFKDILLIEKEVVHQLNILKLLNNESSGFQKIDLHLNCTKFQLNVWKELLNIPFGSLTTYGTIAEKVGNKNAVRAVGTAIGANPIAFVIPCHRVVHQSGMYGNYRWGAARKIAMLGWEVAQKHQ